MDKEIMKQLIVDDITSKLGNDVTISIQEVFKTNVKRDGLTILKKGNNVAPTIYLEPYYIRLLQREPISNITKDILSMYDNAMAQGGKSTLDISFLKDFQEIIPRLFVKIINKHMNEELLKNTPYICFLDDFAIIPYCLMEIVEDGTASFLIQNTHMQMWNIDKDSLITLAIANTNTLFGVELKSMKEVLLGMNAIDLPFPEELNPPIYILTNKYKLNGAATILFDDVLKKFAKAHGNFYVIFSSIHEALLIPDDYDLDLASLTSMNREVNATKVPDDEILGTKAYFYDEKKGFVIK